MGNETQCNWFEKFTLLGPFQHASVTIWINHQNYLNMRTDLHRFWLHKVCYSTVIVNFFHTSHGQSSLWVIINENSPKARIIQGNDRVGRQQLEIYSHTAFRLFKSEAGITEWNNVRDHQLLKQSPNSHICNFLELILISQFYVYKGHKTERVTGATREQKTRTHLPDEQLVRIKSTDPVGN